MASRKIYVLCLFIGVFNIEMVRAGAPGFIPNDDDIRLLPAYCAAKLKGVNEGYWRKILGNDFIHMHHLCYAHNARRKSKISLDNEATKYLRQRALANYNYMENHAGQSFILRPVVYIEKADVYNSLKQNKQAEKYYLKAIQFKPDYVKGYIVYSRFLKKIGRSEDAINILKKGLKYKPDSKLLKRHLTRLTKND